MTATQMLLERSGELELLSGILGELWSSGGRVVLIRGEAGVGKTSLVRAFLAKSDEAHLLFGACDDLRTPQPLGPFWDMARAEPSLMEPLEVGDRQRLHAGVLDLLDRSLRPTIVVIEDTQWADEASLDAIKYLGRRIEHTNGLLLLTYRDGEVDYDHPLRSVIGEMPPHALVRIHLASLSEKAVEEMIRGSGLDSKELMALTAGNPLLVSELLEWGEEGMPVSVHDSVLARLAKLSAKSREAVELVSVIPGEAEREIIDGILGLWEEPLREGEKQGLIRVGDSTVVFVHELTRRAVESTLGPDTRRHLNGRVLEALTATPDLAGPARLAHHAHEAGDVDSVLAYAPDAARQAVEAGSDRQGVDHYRRLRPYVHLLPKESRARIYEEWAEAEAVMSNYREAIQVIEAARSLRHEQGDRSGESYALTRAAYFHEWLGQRGRAEECARQAIEVLGPNPEGVDLAWALEANAYLASRANRAEDALALADRALSSAGPEIDEVLLIRCLNVKGGVLDFQYPDGLLVLLEAATRARAAGLWSEEARALGNHAWYAAEWRDLATAEDFVQQALAVVAGHENTGIRWVHRTFYARVLELKGEWHRAEDLARDTALQSLGFVQILALPIVGRLEARQGRNAAMQTLRHAWELATASEWYQGRSLAAAALAEYAWISGNVPAPISELTNLMKMGLAQMGGWGAGSIALWLWKLGEFDGAPDGIAEPYRLIIDSEPLTAARIWEERGCIYDQAIALTHGDLNAQLEGLELLDTLGATAVAAKVRRELRARGVSVPRGRGRATREHPVGLTARQSEILALLAEKLTNVEIADRLFLSPRTVEHHVSAVMSKLNATTRDEAVEVAVRRGLLTPL